MKKIWHLEEIKGTADSVRCTGFRNLKTLKQV